jgi:hypothetical protein
MSSVKFILVDDRRGFWHGSDAWRKAFPDTECVRIGNFRSDDNTVAALLKGLQAEGKSLDDREWPEVCIVTDANLGRSNLDGAELLESLRSAGKKWMRAVVYSLEPGLNDFCERLGQTIVRAVSNMGDRDAERIRRFLESGTFPRLDLIWGLWRYLTPLTFCLDVINANVKGAEKPLIFPKMKAYGMPESEMEKETFPFSPLLARNFTDGFKLFTTESAMLFLEESKNEFIELAAFSRGSQPDALGPEDQWRELVWALHPFESLNVLDVSGVGENDYPIHPLRVLWELIQTGGDQRLLLTYTASNLDSLKACERVWVRRRLAALGDRITMIRDDAEALMDLFRKCRQEMVKIRHIRDAAIEAEQDISSGRI